MNANIICQTQFLEVLTGQSPKAVYTVFDDFSLTGDFLPPVASPVPYEYLKNLNKETGGTT
jgi:hypothetical protein